MKLADITKIIEGVLFVAGEGVDRDEFKRVYDLSDKEINKCLEALKEKYNKDSGVNVITYKNKIQLCSNPDLADSIAEILNPIRERSLTKSALETIAIVAYKQPITRTEIEQIRGVNCDYAVQLLQKNNLIEVVGRKDAVGKPLLFGTTDEFLKRFELDSLEALPNYKELLDRIRVIHSEGDSLYREFTIPDEDENDEGGEALQNQNNNLVEQDNNLDDKQTNSSLQGEEQLEENNQDDLKMEQELDKDLEKPSKKADNVEVEVKEQADSKKSTKTSSKKLINKGDKQDEESSPKEVEVEIKTSKKSKNSLDQRKTSNIQSKIKSLEEIVSETSSLFEEKGEEQPLPKGEPEKIKKSKLSKIVENNSDEQLEKTAENIVEEQTPKLSWKDKIRARLAQNAQNNEN